MFGMLHFGLFVALAVIVAVAAAPKEIYDPFFVFCGSKSCYEILEIRRNATNKQIRRAYRRLSLEYHPDKSKHANATEAFRLISKAYEVLDTNTSRVSFDYYLNNPRDYFKVSGHHYMRTLPKSDVRLVILLVVCLISWMMHVMQEQKHQNFMKHLKDAVLNCAGNAKSNNQTLALFKRCTALYEAKMKEASWAGSGTDKTNVGKMVKDPLFADCVSEIVATVKIEGGYRKPETEDLFIVRLAYLPLTLFNWLATYYRRYISTAPLSNEEKYAMAKESLGPGTWENITESERADLVGKEIWKYEVREKWLESRGTAVRMVVEEDQGGAGPEGTGGVAGSSQVLNRKQRRHMEKVEKKKKE